MLYPLGRDPDYLGLNLNFAVDVMKSCAIISFIPSFARPYAAINGLVYDIFLTVFVGWQEGFSGMSAASNV